MLGPKKFGGFPEDARTPPGQKGITGRSHCGIADQPRGSIRGAALNTHDQPTDWKRFPFNLGKFPVQLGGQFGSALNGLLHPSETLNYDLLHFLATRFDPPVDFLDGNTFATQTDEQSRSDVGLGSQSDQGLGYAVRVRSELGAP